MVLPLQVLPPLALGMALRLVLFALRQPPSTRAFGFGIAVLRVMAPRMQRSFNAFSEQVLLTGQVRPSPHRVSELGKNARLD